MSWQISNTYRVGGRPGDALHRPRDYSDDPLQDGAEAAKDVDLRLSADPRSLVPRQQEDKGFWLLLLQYFF